MDEVIYKQDRKALFRHFGTFENAGLGRSHLNRRKRSLQSEVAPD